MPIDPQTLAHMEQIAKQRAIIRMLESSNGQNMNHATLTNGPNAGETAGGAYGMVPSSLNDFAKQSMNRNIGVDPDILVEMDKKPNEVTQDLNNNRELDDKTAEMALNVLNQKTGWDNGKTAYAWNNGQNRSPEEMLEGAQNSPYAQKFQELYAQKYPEGTTKKQSDVDALKQLSPDFFARIKAMIGAKNGNNDGNY